VEILKCHWEYKWFDTNRVSILDRFTVEKFFHFFRVRFFIPFVILLFQLGSSLDQFPTLPHFPVVDLTFSRVDLVTILIIFTLPHILGASAE
jgi:hypothetical protein